MGLDNKKPEGNGDSSKLSAEQARVYASRYFPEFNLQDKVIVVTGGGRGLGLNMAEALFQGGAIGMKPHLRLRMLGSAQKIAPLITSTLAFSALSRSTFRASPRLS